MTLKHALEKLNYQRHEMGRINSRNYANHIMKVEQQPAYQTTKANFALENFQALIVFDKPGPKAEKSTAQKMKFSIKDFFSKFLMENFIFCVVKSEREEIALAYI